jgi:D-xylose transport system permease protein
VKLERNAEKQGRRIDLNAWAMAGVLAVMWAILALLPATRGMFLTQGNIATLLSQCSVLLVVSVGMTMVILIRGIDLSVGAGVALAGVIAALVQVKLGLSAPWAMLAALAAGAAIGAWHGLWVGWLGIPAFIVTLAGFKAYRGGALVASDATSLQMGDDFAVLNATVPVSATWAIVLGVLAIGLVVVFREARRREAFGLEPLTTSTVAIRMAGQVLLAGLILAVFGSRGVPVPVLVAGAVALAGVFVTRRTRFGVISTRSAATPRPRGSGIAVKKVTPRRLHADGRADRARRAGSPRLASTVSPRATRATCSVRCGDRRRDQWDLDRGWSRLRRRNRARHDRVRDAVERMNLLGID